jgi:hypothetical protein
MGKFAAAVCLWVFPLAGFAADRVSLKNGSTYYGQFVSGTDRQIVFQDENGTRRQFNLRDIDTIAFDAQRTGAGNSTYRDTRDTSRNAGRYSSADRSTVGNSRVYKSIPSGAEIQVRTNEQVDSRTATEGRTYSAEVHQDVMDERGGVAIPRGAEAELVLREIKEGGTTSSPELILDVQSVRMNGQRYLVSTEDVSQSGREGIGKNRRTAEMLGGGAALGGLLGAIAGGGKGAVIGAITGAAAGGAVQVLTKGKEVRVPAETILTFKLDQPVRLELVR